MALAAPVRSLESRRMKLECMSVAVLLGLLSCTLIHCTPADSSKKSSSFQENVYAQLLMRALSQQMHTSSGYNTKENEQMMSVHMSDGLKSQDQYRSELSEKGMKSLSADRRTKHWNVGEDVDDGMKHMCEVIYDALQVTWRDGILGDVLDVGLSRVRASSSSWSLPSSSSSSALDAASIFAAGMINWFNYNRSIWVCNSFQGSDGGVSDGDRNKCEASKRASVSIESAARQSFDHFGLLQDNVHFVWGHFGDSMLYARVEKIAVLKLNLQLYASTLDVLFNVYPKISDGGYVIIEDWNAPAQKQAVLDFRSMHEITDEIVHVDGRSEAYWRKHVHVTVKQEAYRQIISYACSRALALPQDYGGNGKVSPAEHNTCDDEMPLCSTLDLLPDKDTKVHEEDTTDNLYKNGKSSMHDKPAAHETRSKSTTAHESTDYVQAVTRPLLVVDVARTQQYFFHLGSSFGNSDDLAGAERLFLLAASLGFDVKDTVVLVAGTNDGQSSISILMHCPSITFYGFEIQKLHFENAKEKLKQFSHVKMLNLGWSEFASENVSIGGIGGLAGLYDAKGQRGLQLQNETASTVTLSAWTSDNAIHRTFYVLIDTEGHEARIIRGMHLEQEENQKKFPMFQYELGGTWALRDNRNGNDPWSQSDAAHYLENLGYMLFMIGSEEWLYVTAEFFYVYENVAIKDEGYGPFVQGNVLAVHARYSPPNLVSRIFEHTHVVATLKLNHFAAREATV